MPHYDYECQKCGYVFEVFQKMTDKPVEKCPQCGGRVKKLIGSGAGLIFKGSGFYITDYKRNSGDKTNNGRKNSAASPSGAPKKDAPASSGSANQKHNAK